MRAKLKKILYYSIPFLASLTFLVLIAGLFFLPVMYRENQIWNNYYTVLVEDSEPVERIDTILHTGGFPDVIHKNNTMVSFFSFHSEERIELSALPARLDELDPRYDDYMKRLEHYFHTEGSNTAYNVYYVKDRRPPILFYIMVRSALHDTTDKWRVAEIDFTRQTVMLLLFSVFMVLTVLYRKTYKIFLIISGIPWLCGLVLSGFTIFSGAALLYLAFALLATDLFAIIKYYLNYHHIDFSQANLPQKLSLLGLALIASAIFTIFPEARLSRWVPLLFSLLANCCVFVVFAFFLFQKRKKQEHRLFFSVSIHPPKVGLTVKTVRLSLLSAIMVVIIAAPLVYRITGNDNQIKVPAPETIHDTDPITWYSIEHLRYYRDNSLPDLFDFLSHKAYQSGFFYNRNYRFPSKGEKISISYYSRGEDKIVRKERVIKVLSESWFREVIAQAKREGITKLLLDQGGVVNVKMRSYRPAAGYDVASILRHAVISLIVFLPLVVINYHLTAQNKYGMKRFILRRKRQAA